LSGFSYDYEEEESNDKKNETMMAGEDDKKSDMMDDDKKEKPVDAVPEPEPVTGKKTAWINCYESYFLSLLRSQFYELNC
jgi:hypothetical protein